MHHVIYYLVMVSRVTGHTDSALHSGFLESSYLHGGSRNFFINLKRLGQIYNGRAQRREHTLLIEAKFETEIILCTCTAKFHTNVIVQRLLIRL